jgi:RNA polymerase sigma-70 factor (ECF subfamily)
VASVSSEVHAGHDAAELGREPVGDSGLKSRPLRTVKNGKARAGELVPASCSGLSDQELLEGIRLQSERHFAELYNRYFQRIYNFVYARMRDHAETEEVVQETFLAVFRSFGNYRGQSSLLSWIYGISKNTMNNSLRRAKSQRERIDFAEEEGLLPQASIGVGAPDEELELSRFQIALSSRLEELADWQTEIFELRHLGNLSIPEISARTARSSDAVRSSLYRVKRMFFEAAMAAGQPVVGEHR